MILSNYWELIYIKIDRSETMYMEGIVGAMIVFGFFVAFSIWSYLCEYFFKKSWLQGIAFLFFTFAFCLDFWMIFFKWDYWRIK